MIEPEFPEDDEMRPVDFKPRLVLSPAENAALDIKTLQKDRRKISSGYPFKTFDEMSGETAAKNWLIKGVLAKGETSAWIAPPEVSASGASLDLRSRRPRLAGQAEQGRGWCRLLRPRTGRSGRKEDQGALSAAGWGFCPLLSWL